jgi:hypothetical protein
MAGRDSGGDATVVTGPAASWEAYLTSAIGADHVRAGTPNQDAIAATKFEFPGAPSLLAFAVADGHGHPRHFRSDRGSKLAVAVAVSTARAWADTVHAGTAVTQAATSQLVSAVVADWRELVAADLAADPLSDTQLSRLLPDDPPEIPYGATLLLGVLRPDVAVLAQIGDGEIFLVLPDGRHLAPIPADSRLDGTQTTSLCQADAVPAFRIAVVNVAKTQVFGIFAATDGYGNAQAEARWQEGVAADLVALGSEHGLEWIGSQLGGWAALCASSDGSGDDSTVALALNSAVALAPPTRRPRRSFSGQEHHDQTLPNLRSAAAEKTLIQHDRPAPAGAIRPVTAPGYGGPFAAARSAFAQRPLLWLGGAFVLALAVVAIVLLSTHNASGRSPAFRQNVTPAHSPAKPTARSSPTPASSGSRT